MKNLRWIAVIALFGASAARSAEPEVDDAVLAAVKQLTLRVTFMQAIGKFSSFRGPIVGDTLELDLGALPEEKLVAMSPRAGTPYIPLSAPLQFVKVRTSMPATSSPMTLVQLAAEGRASKLLIRVNADGLKSGDKVRVTLYTNDGFIGSMGEAEGVWK